MVKVLLIEDDLDDVELLEDTFKDNGLAYQLDVINDGSDAIQHLNNCTIYPDIIILDFNLPKVHGRDILMEIKSLNAFKNIPVLILTTSSAKEDMDYAYKNGANRFLIKPTNVSQIKEMYAVIVELIDGTGKF
jgi:CheY-like chemotaxis protein